MRHTDREEGHVKMKPKIGVRLPQVKEPELPEAGRAKDGFLRILERECSPADTLISDLWPL